MPITSHTAGGRIQVTDANTITWAAIPNGNSADAAGGTTNEYWSTAYFQVTGTFGAGGSVQLEGSNDGVNWIKLSPPALTAAGFFAPLGVTERPRFLRPNVTAGDVTTALTVTGCLK